MQPDLALIRDKTAPILFLTANRLGDAILTTGALQSLLEAFPDAPVTIVCGALPAPIFAGLPDRVTVIPLRKQPYGRHWLNVWRKCITTRWGTIIDLRNTPVSRLLWRDRLVCHTASPPLTTHRAAYFSQLLGLPQTRNLQVWLSEEAAMRAAFLVPPGPPVIAFGPTANWIGKMWPVERFVALAARMVEREEMGQVRFAVIAAGHEDAAARPLLEALPPERRIDLIGQGDTGVALACLQRCAGYIGNDSGLMHGAAALGIPTLGLFGPTSEKAYGPYGPNAYAVRGRRSMEELTGHAGFDPKQVHGSLMDDLQVDDVYAAFIKLLQHCQMRRVA